MEGPPIYPKICLFTEAIADYPSDVWTWFEDGAGVDWTDCTASLDFRVTPADSEPLFSASVTLGTGGAQGEVSFTIAAADLADVVVPVAHGDLLIARADGTVLEFAHVVAEIEPGSSSSTRTPAAVVVVTPNVQPVENAPPFYTRDEIFTYADFTSKVWTWLADGVGVDLSGATASLDFRVVPTDEEPLFSASVIVLGTPGTGNAGEVLFQVARASLEGVTVPVVHGDLLITMSDGSPVEFAHVTLDIVQGSTHP